jgi:hypothetical protein
LITNPRIKENQINAVGPEYIALFLTAVTTAATAGSWAANKFLNRSYERVRMLNDELYRQEVKINSLEDTVNKMPLDYVLKVDFLREIQRMQDNFKEINNKLDTLMAKLLVK